MGKSNPKMNNKIIGGTAFGSVCVLWLISKNRLLISHVLLSRPDIPAEKTAAKLFPDLKKSSCAEMDAVADSITAYLEGEPVTFSLNLVDLSSYTKFQQSVLRAQHAIPRGAVTTYGLLAAHIGAPGGARAVGNVMAANPFPLIIPCHRTVLSDLRLGGFQSGAGMKRALLEKEGIAFDEAGRVVCKRLQYDSGR